MTKAVVNSGICGFSVTVIAGKREGKEIHISLDTECEMVKKMAEDISSLDMMAAFTGFANNPVYKSAARHLKHAACPVPSAILKAVEVEAGLCIPKGVKMSFIRD
ncbi:MAG: hypothetical protein Q8K51_12120 [Nitrospirota bacterium]|nr:hypothetical protein [Nitrospirota bacterium]